MKKTISAILTMLLLISFSATTLFTCYAEGEDELFSFSADFTGLNTTATEWDIVNYMASKGIKFDLKVKNVSINSEESCNAAINDGIIDENNGAEITADGRLRLFSNQNRSGAATLYQYMYFSPITTRLSNAKYIRVEFDIQMSNYLAGGNYGASMINFIKMRGKTGGTDFVRIDAESSGAKLALKKGTSGTTLQTLVDDAGYTSHRLMFLIDMNNGSAKISVDGGDYIQSDSVDGVKGHPFKDLAIIIGNRSGEGLMEAYIDNLSMTEIYAPEVSERIPANGSTAVSVDSPVLKFNVAVAQSEAEKIKLYENGTVVENLAYTLSDGGKTLTIGSGLKYSTPYKIIIPENVKSQNGLFFPTETINFHTMHKPLPIEAPTAAFTDKDTGLSITSLADPNLTTASVTATLTQAAGATGAEKVILMVAVFRDGVEMENVSSVTGVVSDGSITADVDLPTDRTNLSIKAFIWDEYQKMQALGDVISYPAL